MSEAVAQESAGRLLRQAREAAGLHVAALAVALKVPVRKLESLESDRYEELTDAVFARALASSVCRTLKIDARPILDRLPQTSAPRLVQDREGLNEPFRGPGDPAAPRWFEHLTQPVFLVVYALLLGALVLVFLPSLRRDEAVAGKTEPVAPPTGMTTPALAPLASASEAVQVPAPIVVEAVSVPAAAPAHPAASVSMRAPATVAVAAPTAAAPPAGAHAGAETPAPSAADGIVVFHTRGPSWVEVVDSRGNVALRRLLAAGETAGASGALPLAVTVGSASVTTVEVRGKPFALAPAIVKDNVARFDIK